MDIVSGAQEILEMYNRRVPDPPPFKVIASSSSVLSGPDVVHALLVHAPRQSEVALAIWTELSPCLQGVVDCIGNPERFDTLRLIFNSTLDAMNEQGVSDLTEAINGVAYKWVSRLILPSMRLLHVPDLGLKLLPVRASGRTPFSESARPTAQRLQAFRTKACAGICTPCVLFSQSHSCSREMDTAAQFPLWWILSFPTRLGVIV